MFAAIVQNDMVITKEEIDTWYSDLGKALAKWLSTQQFTEEQVRSNIVKTLKYVRANLMDGEKNE